jgi:hypothetical protein
VAAALPNKPEILSVLARHERGRTTEDLAHEFGADDLISLGNRLGDLQRRHLVRLERGAWTLTLKGREFAERTRASSPAHLLPPVAKPRKGKLSPNDVTIDALWMARVRTARPSVDDAAVSSDCEFRGNPAGDSDLMSATIPI